jgi:hypothetical protein
MQFIKNRLFLNGVNPVFYGAELSIFPRGIPEKEGGCLQNKQNYLKLNNFFDGGKLQAVSLGGGLIGYFAIENINSLGQARIFPNRLFPPLIGQHFNIGYRGIGQGNG